MNDLNEEKFDLADKFITGFVILSGIAFFITLIIIAITGAKEANAASGFEITPQTFIPVHIGNWTGNSCGDQDNVTQTFLSPISGNLDTITLTHTATGTVIGDEISVIISAPTSSLALAEAINVSSTLCNATSGAVFLGSIPIELSTEKLTTTWSPNVNSSTLEEGKYYKILFTPNADVSLKLYGSVSDTYLNGKATVRGNQSTSTTLYDLNLIFNSSPSSSEATSFLSFPTANTTSTTYPDWNGNWVTEINNAQIGKNYYQKVKYSLISSSNPLEPQARFKTFEDISSVIPDTATDFTWAFPKTHALTWDFNDTRYGWLIDYTFGTDPTFATFTSHSQYMVYINYFSPNTPTSTASTYAGQFTSTSTYKTESDRLNARFGATGCDISASSTYAIWNPADWSCITKIAIHNFSDAALALATDGFQELWGIMGNIFPLNLVIKFNEILNQAQNIPIDKQITLPVGPYKDHPLILVSSSSLAYLKNTTGFDYRDFVDKLLYALTGGAMFLISLGIIRGLRHKYSKA